MRARTATSRPACRHIKAEALRQGVPAAIADRAFQGLTPDQKVIDLDLRQPEFSLTYAKYVGASVTPDRIVKGQQRMAQTSRPARRRCRPSTACRRNTSWSFWGMETNYGSFMGDFQVVRSVATLGLHDQAHRLLQQRDGAGAAHPRR